MILFKASIEYLEACLGLHMLSEFSSTASWDIET